MSCRSYSSLPTRNSQVMDSELVPFPQSCITPSFRQSRNSSLLSGTTSTSNRSLSKSMDTSLMVPSRRSLPMTLSAPWQPPHHHSVIFAALALLQQLKACSSLCYFCCSRFAPATQRALIPLLPLLLSFFSSDSRCALLYVVHIPPVSSLCLSRVGCAPPLITPSIIT